jgi:hypothetical protein
MRQKITQIGFSVFAVVAIFFAAPAHAAILFQNDTFATIESDNILINSDAESSGDMVIQFGTSLAKTLKYSVSNSRFEINAGLDLDNNQISTARVENVTAMPGGAGGLGSAGTGRIVELTATDGIAPGCTSPSCPTGTYSWNGAIWKPLQGSVTAATATKIVTVGPTGRDYTTISAAAAYLNTLSAGEMWIDPGSFSVTTTINLENISLVGAATSETTISISGAGLLQVKDTTFEKLTLDNSSQTGTYGLDVKYNASSISSLFFKYVNFTVGTSKYMIASSAGTKPTTISTMQNCTQSLTGGSILNTVASANLNSATSTFTIINLLGNALRMSDWPVIIIGGSNVVTNGTITTVPDRTINVSPGMNIQGAINSLGSNGGVIKLLIGVHDITTSLVIANDNIEIVGEGPGTTLLAKTSTWTGGTSNNDAVIQVGLATGASPRTNVIIRNFKLQVGPNIHGIEINGGTENKVMDMIVQSIGPKSGTRTGIVFTDGATVQGARFTATRNIINDDSTANRWVDGVHFDGKTGTQLFGYGNGIIDSIISETMVAEGAESSYVFANISASSVFSNRARDIGASAAAMGMYFNDATDIMVINNTLEGSTAAATGIDIDTVNNSVVVGNAVRGGTVAFATGINITSSASAYNIVTDNQFNNVTTKISDSGTATKLETNHHRATTNPTTGDDIAAGYDVGTIWINTTAQTAFISVNSTAGAAVWQNLGSSAAITGTTSNTFTLDTDNTGGNVTLQFGTTLAETLTWDSTNTRFNLSDDLNIGGDLSVSRLAITAVNGNNNNFAVGSYSFARITGPTAAFTITGITGGRDGKILVLYNTTGQTMNLSNENTNSTAANRILTLGANPLPTTGTGSVVLMYDGSASRWIVTAIQA